MGHLYDTMTPADADLTMEVNIKLTTYGYKAFLYLWQYCR